MSPSDLGELAALGAATVWAFSSLFFTAGGKRVGALVVNRMRLLFAVLLVGATHWLLFGRPFPVEAEPVSLLLAGPVGGDRPGHRRYAAVSVLYPGRNARIGVLLFALGPVFSVLLAWALLGETLSLPELGAMTLALAGVMWVVLERQVTGEAPTARRRYALGLLYGAGAQLCQAANLVTAKRGSTAAFRRFPAS